MGGVRALHPPFRDPASLTQTADHVRNDAPFRLMREEPSTNVRQDRAITVWVGAFHTWQRCLVHATTDRFYCVPIGKVFRTWQDTDERQPPRSLRWSSHRWEQISEHLVYKDGSQRFSHAHAEMSCAKDRSRHSCCFFRHRAHEIGTSRRRYVSSCPSPSFSHRR